MDVREAGLEFGPLRRERSRGEEQHDRSENPLRDLEEPTTRERQEPACISPRSAAQRIPARRQRVRTVVLPCPADFRDRRARANRRACWPAPPGPPLLPADRSSHAG